MDKTERLFAIMDALRRHRRPITAAALAEEQAVSVRTLYRDIQTLIGLGAPIDGEAKTYKFLRVDRFNDRASCVELIFQKGKQIIAEQGDKIFR